MSDFNTQIKKKASAITLRAAERRVLRERIVTYMEYHPLPKVTKASEAQAVPTPFPFRVPVETLRAFRINQRQLYGSLVVGMLMLSVGVPTLAERALPGDVLYPMKVKVNEEVRSGLAFSSYAKVEWEAERLERRLSEARLLAQKGRLTADVELEVAEAVKRHSDNAQETILSMRESDSESAALAEIAFASVLDAQADIIALHDEQQNGQSEGNESTPVVTVLASAVAEARTNARQVESQVPVTPERLFALIERETTVAEELFRSVAEGATEAEARKIERRLADIGRKVAHAETLNARLREMGTVVPEASAATTEATATSEVSDNMMMLAVSSEQPAPKAAATTEEVIVALRAALTDTRKLISFMTDIDVRTAVDVEALIPVVPTDEERAAEVRVRMERVERERTAIAETPLENRATKKRVNEGLEQIDAVLARARTALEAQAIVEAEGAVDEAAALVKDLEAVLEVTAEVEGAASSSASTSIPGVINRAGSLKIPVGL